METEYQRAGTKITKDLCSKYTPKPSTRDLPKTTSEAEPRTEVADVGGHKMHIFTTNIPTFHSRYRR
jgi:hypothetical protein